MGVRGAGPGARAPPAGGCWESALGPPGAPAPPAGVTVTQAGVVERLSVGAVLGAGGGEEPVAR